MSGIFSGGGGGSTTTVTNTTPPASREEKALLALNTELAKKQLAAIDELAPFQRQLLDMSTEELTSQRARNEAMRGAVTPEQEAAQYRADFERSQRMGPLQDELLTMQLDALRQGGRATPEQIAAINAATEAGISAGSEDINASTARGIGLIADELANARGLRLTDSPITGEAAMLAREGEIQKGSLIKNLRANEANARLNYPLAVQGLQSGINLNQQQMGNAAQQFQQDLRQRAYQNRMALTGQAQSGGIGIASVGGLGLGALNSMTQSRLANNTSTQNSNFSRDLGMSDYANLARGIGGLSGFM